MGYAPTMRAPNSILLWSLLVPSAVITLACGGLLGGSSGEVPRIKPNPDANDMAERARLEREYQRAEAILKNRLKKNPDDHHAHRLLGDVNLTRGADYKKKWKENLARAFDSYRNAVRVKPDDCTYWARLAGTVTMAYRHDQTRIPADTLEELPLDQGWANCPGPALVELELRRDPDPEAVAAWNEENPRGTDIERIQALQPWVKEAWDRAPTSSIQWEGRDEDVPLAGGLPFVVVDPPLEARGVGHDYHRGVPKLEVFTTGRVDGGRVVFTDRRFPKELPRTAVVKAPACRYSAWKNNVTTGVASGQCSTSAFLRGESALYAKEALAVAGPGHYAETSIRPAMIPGDEVMWETVRCVGGPVQRKFYTTPTCPVEYMKPNWLQRALHADKVRGARSSEHSRQMIQAAAMAPVWGEELTDRMLRQDIGVGMPYSLFRYWLENENACQGRMLLNNHLINGGELEWTCGIGDMAYTFVDQQLTWYGTRQAYQEAMQLALAPDDEALE